MATQRITINLPEAVYRALVRIAEVTEQPVELLVAQSVIGNLPPSIDNAAPELQPELLRMQTLSNEEIVMIAQSQIDPVQAERHRELLARNEARLAQSATPQEPLTSEERQELSGLRQATDHLMLRKAYAWSLLRWRGQRIPSLEELPLPQ